MSNFQILDADRKQIKLRIGLGGLPGSGKTFSSILLAKSIASSMNKIVIIDTENKRAEYYSHLGPYKVLQFSAPFTPERYIEAIELCEKQGFEVIIIDSMSHEWEAEGGMLELVSLQDQKVNNTGWMKTTPRHNKFKEKIVQSPCHILATFRMKAEMAYDKNEFGKTVPKKIGVKLTQREGWDYEFTLFFELQQNDHRAICTKDCTTLGFMDLGFMMLNEQVGESIVKWNNSGTNKDADSSNLINDIKDTASKLGYIDIDKCVSEISKNKYSSLDNIPKENLSIFLNVIKQMLLDKNTKQPKQQKKEPEAQPTQQIPNTPILI